MIPYDPYDLNDLCDPYDLCDLCDVDGVGLYECQVSSLEPKISRLIYLNVVQARSQIGDNSSAPIYLRLNDKLNLTCTVFAPEQPDYIYWYKNNQVST